VTAPPAVAAVPTKFGALRHRDYRHYFLLALVGMTAESIAIWGTVMAIFPLVHGYAAAVILLVLAGIFNIAFTSMAQALVQILAPPRLRGRVVGLFNTSMLGLRAGSGVTVGVLGALIGVERSLALSAAAVVAVAVGLLIADVRARAALTHVSTA